MEYAFQHLPRGSVDLTRRYLWADVELFSHDKTPVEELVTIINECNSDLTCTCYEYAPGPPGDMKKALADMFARAVRNSVRNTQLLMAASQFFGITFSSQLNCLSQALTFQPLTAIEFILRDCEETYSTTPNLWSWGCDREGILTCAAKNPCPYVSRLMEYYYLAAPPDRKAHLSKWRQVMSQPYVDTLHQLARSPDSQMAYVVSDVRNYLIEPYLANFLLYV